MLFESYSIVQYKDFIKNILYIIYYTIPNSDFASFLNMILLQIGICTKPQFNKMQIISNNYIQYCYRNIGFYNFTQFERDYI